MFPNIMNTFPIWPHISFYYTLVLFYYRCNILIICHIQLHAYFTPCHIDQVVKNDSLVNWTNKKRYVPPTIKSFNKINQIHNQNEYDNQVWHLEKSWILVVHTTCFASLLPYQLSFTLLSIFISLFLFFSWPSFKWCIHILSWCHEKWFHAVNYGFWFVATMRDKYIGEW